MTSRRGAGSAIAITFLLLFVLVTFGTAYLRAVTGEGNFTARLRLSTQALCLAESSLAEAVRTMREEAAIEGSRTHSFLSAARDGASFTIDCPQCAALAAECAPGATVELETIATVERSSDFTPRMAEPDEAAGQLRIRARVRLGPARAMVEEWRDYKAARVTPAPAFEALHAELVSRFFRSAEEYRLCSGGAERFAQGLVVASLPVPPREDQTPAEGGGVLYFGGSGRIRPSDGSAGRIAVTLSSRITGWKRVREE